MRPPGRRRWLSLSLRTQISVFLLLAIALMGAIIGVVTFQLLSSYSRQQQLDQARQQAKGLARVFAAQIPRAIERGVEIQPVGPDNQQLLTSGGRLFYAGLTPTFQSRPFLSRLPGEVSMELQISERVIQRRETIDAPVTLPGDDFESIAVATPLVRPAGAGGGTPLAIAAIVLTRPRSTLEAQVLPLTQRVLVAVAAGALLTIAFGLYLTRRMSAPLRDLTLATERVAAGDYAAGERPPTGGGGSGEVGRLSAAFSSMAGELALTEQRQREFLLAVSHELRTPLTALTGHAEAVRDGISPDPDASLTVVAVEAQRLQRLVEDLLDLARIDARRFRLEVVPVDATALLERVGALFSQRAIDRQIAFAVDVAALPAGMRTDPVRVSQVVTNLVENAMVWTPNGGRAGLAARPLAAGGPDGGPGIEVMVTDSGPGIPAADRERIFRRFFTTRGTVERRVAGTGLGLAIALELTLQMGGRLTFDAPEGGGSAFRLWLPLRAPGAGGSDDDAPTVAATPRGRAAYSAAGQ